MAAPNERAAWLKGPVAECELTPRSVPRPWRLVLLGAPGVGKGTQADLLHQRLHACHLSTGDVFRAAGKQAECDLTPAMTEALDYMRRGALVPDSTVWEMVRERSRCLRCGGGFILDGFPRTLAQAESLRQQLDKTSIALTAVIHYELTLAEIVTRLSERRTCEKCKAVFQVTGRPPKTAGSCDNCGGMLFERDDDRPQSIKIRLEAYRRSTAPLIDFYERLGLLIPVSASGTAEDICARTLTELALRRIRNTENPLNRH